MSVHCSVSFPLITLCEIFNILAKVTTPPPIKQAKNSRFNFLLISLRSSSNPTKEKHHVRQPYEALTREGVLIAVSCRYLINTVDQQAIVRARAQAAVQARHQIASGVEEFIQDCVWSLREQTSDLCAEMLTAMHTGKTGVHQKTLNRLTDFIDKVKALNFAGDRELEERLEEVRKAFLTRTAQEYRDSASSRQRLTRGIQDLADTARELASADTSAIVDSFGAMGVRRLNLSKGKAA